MGGLLRELHFWRNANALVEQAYWSGTGAFVLSAENLTVVKGKAVPGPDTRLKLDYDPASCILPLRVERGHRERSGLCLRVYDGGQARGLSADPHRQ